MLLSVETCECLGDLETVYQSRTILDLICRNDALAEGNYHWSVSADRTTYQVLANKTRSNLI